MNTFFSSESIRFLFGKKVKPESVAIYPFLLLSLLIFCNLNGILFSIFKISALGSPLILLSSLSIISLVSVKPGDFNWAFITFISFLLMFLITGWISGLVNFDNSFFSFSSALKGTRELITAMIIITTYYIFGNWFGKKNHPDQLIVLVFVFFFITLLAGIFENVLGLRDYMSVGVGDSERSLGFFGNPNETGYQANLTMMLSFYLYLRKRIRILSLLLLLSLSFYGAVLSFSKSAILSSIILIILISVFQLFRAFSRNRIKRFESWKFIILFSLILFLGIRFIIIPFVKDLAPGQLKRVEVMTDLIVKGEFDNKTTSNRAGIFKDAVDLIKLRPVLGYGLNAFSKGGMFKSSPKHGVHNMFLKIAGESGIIMLLFFLFTLIYFIWISIFKIKGPEGFLLFSFIILFSLYSFGSHNSFGDKFSIGLFGVILSISYKTNKPNSKNKKIIL